MHAPVDMRFLGIERSNELAQEIQDKLSGLEAEVERIDRCRVVVEAVESEFFQEKNYRVQIQLSIPHRDVVVGGETDEHHEYDDPFIAVDDAFEMLRDRLRDHVEERYTEHVHGAARMRGVIAKICLPEGPEFPQHGRGMISTCDGREFYFHADDLVDIEFQRLELGSQVEFAERPGLDRPEAASIRIVGQPQVFLI